MASMGFGMTPRRIREIAFEYCEKNELQGFGKKGVAGYTWFKNWLKRHPQMSKKMPVKLSVARAMNSNQATLDAWFDLYERMLLDLKITRPEQIFNIDESGVESIPKRQVVVGRKGKIASQTVSRDRGDRTTVLTFANAAGEHFPPMVIHPGGSVQEAWFKDSPEDVFLRCSESGYITKKLFLEYTDHFLDWLEVTGRLDNGPIVVLMDGHSTHTYNSLALDAFEEAGVHVILIPSHTSHHLQPLDKNPFSCFKFYWELYLNKYNHKHSGRAIGKDDFFSVFNCAWYKAMTKRNLEIGFKRSGIWPIDRKQIKPDMLLPNEVFSKNIFCTLPVCTVDVILIYVS